MQLESISVLIKNANTQVHDLKAGWDLCANLKEIKFANGTKLTQLRSIFDAPPNCFVSFEARERPHWLQREGSLRTVGTGWRQSEY